MTEWNTARASAFLYRYAAELVEHLGDEALDQAELCAWNARRHAITSETAFRQFATELLRLTQNEIDVAVLGVQEVRDDR